MPRAADGTPMASFSRAKHHDSMMAEKKPAPKAVTEPPKMEGGKSEHEDSPEDIKAVVAEHGPAHHMEYEEKEGKHHVHSKHGAENHEHHSVHDSKEEAMDHMKSATGAEEESPDEEEGEEMAPAMEESEHSNRIPGMA
jgi:hypothetical protein